MKKIEILIRSTLFNIAFFTTTPLMALCALPTIWMPRRKAMFIVHAWVRLVYALERIFMNLNYEVRGWENVPKGQSFLLAAKHQSAYETMKLHILFDDPAIVLKQELLNIPLWGLFLGKIDPVAIDRSNRDQAIKSLLDGVRHVKEQGRPIVIFPQGTRVLPDATTAEKPYKAGIGRMYELSGLPIVPLALNTGIFWPRNSLIKRPGKVIFQFLPPIVGGQNTDTAMKILQDNLENASNALTAEARKKYPYLPKAKA